MKNKSATRYFSSKQEKHVARVIGGKQVANSGATMFSKGDCSNDNWLIECKTKTSPSQSMSIKKEWLEKNEEEAFAMRKEHFGDAHNAQNYYIISEQEFLRFLKLEEQYERDTGR